MRYLAGIDLGTSAVKAAIFSEKGKLISSASVEYPLYQPRNGWAEQEPEDWYNGAVSAIKTAVADGGVDPADIVSVGMSGQMHGLVMLDRSGQPLRRSIIWCDQRTAEECRELTEKLGYDKLIEITANPALAGFTASKILWVKKNEPEIFGKCRYILLPKDYLRYRLTGELATEVSDASGMQLLDIAHRRWSPEMLEAVGITENMLGKVYESPDITGYITKEASQATGLPVTACVVGGAGDNAAAAVGSGIVTVGKAFTTIGTSGVVFAHTDEPVLDRRGRVHTFCCAVPGKWHVMGVTQAAGLSLKWFRDNFCSAEVETARLMGIDPYVLMDKEAENSPLGANGLLYMPYLMGERTPHLDSECRGAFIGLSAAHSRGDMIRAVMEGVAFSLLDCEEIFSEMGIKINEMYACGGGGRSKVWRGMLADMYGCKVKTLKSSEGAALGAAILAATGAGIYPSVENACSAMTEEGDIIAPDKERTDGYRELYCVFKEVYPALKDIFPKLAPWKR